MNKSNLYVFFLISITFASSANAQSGTAAFPCDNPYAQSEQECLALKEWGEGALTPAERLADPSTKSYKILYHSMCGFQTRDAQTGKLWRTLLLENPSLISSNPKISASLISEIHRKVWSTGVAFILAAAPENIVGTCSSDAGSPGGYHGWGGQDPERALEDYSKKERVQIQSPEKILSQDYGYNEIVLRGYGVRTGNPVRVEGVILHCRNYTGMKRVDHLSDEDFRKLLNRVDCNGSLLVEEKESLMKLRQQLPVFCF